MKFEYLADNENLIPVVAEWYFDEWGYLRPKMTLNDRIKDLKNYLNKDKIPLILMGIDKEEVLGVAQLKFHEMSIYPDKTHWLGGVYVSQKHRGKGIAKQIISELLVIAKNLNVKTLHLHTENLTGGLYRQMGWKPIEQVNYRGIDVLVMEKGI